MKKSYFTLLLVLALTVSAQAVVVPNGNFELILDPENSMNTGILIPVEAAWTQGVGADCPIDTGEYEFSDLSTGTLADIPGWVGYDRDGWIELGGSYDRDQTTGNLQGSIANQGNHTDGGVNMYVANGGDWGNAAGGLITSSAPLEIVDRGKVFELSVFIKGVISVVEEVDVPPSPLKFILLVNGEEHTPDIGEENDPVMTAEWQKYIREYNTLPAGELKIVLGFDRPAEGQQMHFDDVAFEDMGEAGKRATTPAPSNYDINLPLNTPLGWTAPTDVEDPTYDVYLTGPEDPNADTLAPGASTGLTLTSYTPPTALNPGQVYYWKVNVYEPATTETYVGYVWKFSTIPSYASDPDPKNGQTNVFRNKILSWTSGEKDGAGPLSHTLYMDPNEFKVETRAIDVEHTVPGLTEAEYDPDPPLEWSDHFFWRVDEVYSSGIIETSVWEFTVAGSRTCEDNPADIDGDCLVNISDFAAMAANFLDCSYTNDDCP